jgi:hypothetical protein
MTPDEFAGFDLDDVVRKAEADKRRKQEAERAGKAKPAAERVVPSEFFIELRPDYFRIGGIRYRDEDCVYELSDKLLEIKTQAEHLNHASNAKPDEFRACPAPLIYAICKTLYEKKDGQYKPVVYFAREALQSLFQHTLTTLSQAVYTIDMLDMAVHFHEKSTERIPSSLVGPDGKIIIPARRAIDYVRDLLGAYAPDRTPDTMDEVNGVFEWITNGKYVSMDRLNNTPVSMDRLNNTPADETIKREFLFKYADDRVILSAYIAQTRYHAIGVRPVASVSREDKIALLKEVQEMLEPARRGKV